MNEEELNFLLEIASILVQNEEKSDAFSMINFLISQYETSQLQLKFYPHVLYEKASELFIQLNPVQESIDYIQAFLLKNPTN